MWQNHLTVQWKWTWYASCNVLQHCSIYFTYPFRKEPVENMKRCTSSPQKTSIWLDDQSVFYVKSGPLLKKPWVLYFALQLMKKYCPVLTKQLQLPKLAVASCFFVTQQTLPRYLLSPCKWGWLAENYPSLSVSRWTCNNWNLDNTAVLQVYMKFQE